MTKATDTHSEYVILSFPHQQWLHERAFFNVCSSLPVLLLVTVWTKRFQKLLSIKMYITELFDVDENGF
jgi:hypothetical protein